MPFGNRLGEIVQIRLRQIEVWIVFQRLFPERARFTFMAQVPGGDSGQVQANGIRRRVFG